MFELINTSCIHITHQSHPNQLDINSKFDYSGKYANSLIFILQKRIGLSELICIYVPIFRMGHLISVYKCLVIVTVAIIQLAKRFPPLLFSRQKAALQLICLINNVLSQYDSKQAIGFIIFIKNIYIFT